MGGKTLGEMKTIQHPRSTLNECLHGMKRSIHFSFVALLISLYVPGGIRLSRKIKCFNMNSECVITDAGNVSFAIFLNSKA